MPLGTEVGLGLDDIVLDIRTQLRSPKRGIAPLQFSDHFYCGQTAGCIKMPLGMDIGDFVLDGDPALSPPQKGGGAPSLIFGPFLLWPNGWMHQDAT